MPPGKKSETKQVKGVWHKKCYGLLHPEGVWFSFSSFGNRTNKQGKTVPRPQCKNCDAFRDHRRRSTERLVPIGRFMFAFVELERRLGHSEAARRCGISQPAFWRIMHGRHKKTRKETLRKVLKALAEVRAVGEVRHRYSIARGATLRGETERIPMNSKDYYSIHSDLENEQREKRRKAGSDTT